MNAHAHIAETQDDEVLTDTIIARAWALVPGIRERAQETEALGRLPDITVQEAEKAELLKIMVPKKWGGLGLGIRAFYEVCRILAHGDLSTAWTIGFLIEHNWWACRLEPETQRILYADRPWVKAATPFGVGKAERVAGGFKVSGTWGYGTTILNADYAFVQCLESKGPSEPPVALFVVLRRDQVEILNDWHVAGMKGTGSNSIRATDVFVPDVMTGETKKVFSFSDHGGKMHPESIYHGYPFVPTLELSTGGMVLGAAQAMLALSRERLSTSKPWGRARIDMPASRQRWAQANQKIRVAELLYQDVVEKVISKGDAGERWPIEENGQRILDVVTIGQTAKEAIRLLAEGFGTSSFLLKNPEQRYLRDAEMMCTHIQFGDQDVLTERGARLKLGLGLDDFDPVHVRDF